MARSGRKARPEDAVADENDQEIATATADAHQLTFDGERIEDLPIEDEMRDSYLTYAMSTIMERSTNPMGDWPKA